MSEKYERPPKSSVVIARFLASQGFDAETANLIDGYYRKRMGLTERQLRSLDRTESALSRIVERRGLSHGDRLVLGKFIGMHKHMAFDAGLRIGLMAGLHDPGLTQDAAERMIRWEAGAQNGPEPEEE